MKNLIKKLIPKSILLFYHKALASLASVYYSNPSRELVVIGVTGTKGKSTTCNILWHLLENAGYKCGMTSTANFRIHKKEWVNRQKMTMVGRFQLQKLLRRMVSAGCEYAVIETSSEGIAQWRHHGIEYDTAIFLNLTPEHIESHGSFEKYKEAKGRLFKSLKQENPPLRRAGKQAGRQKNNKMIIANLDDPYADYFLGFPADRKITYGIKSSADIIAHDLSSDIGGITWKIDNIDFSLKQIGEFNIYNALPAVALGKSIGLSLAKSSEYLSTFSGMSGRMEEVNCGQNFKVIVDYAYEPKSLELVLKTLQKLFIKEELGNKIIAVSGPTGGGRDAWRRPVMGGLLAEYCRYSIITTDDPYDDDPAKIADEMIAGLEEKNKKSGQDFFKIIDRREAIRKAIFLAKPGDVVLLAGKGSDPVMAVADGKSIPWDDRKEARNILKERINN